jgi:hypothetical protein
MSYRQAFAPQYVDFSGLLAGLIAKFQLHGLQSEPRKIASASVVRPVRYESNDAISAPLFSVIAATKAYLNF